MPSPMQVRGLEEEARAERALRAAGYQIVIANWRGAGAEIDRIAWDGEVLVFVEIRSRRNTRCGQASETVGPAKQRRIARAALAYLAQRREVDPPMVRFDVVSLGEGGDSGRIEIIQAAFDASGLACRAKIPLL